MRVTILVATAAAFCFSGVSAQTQSPKDRAIALARPIIILRSEDA